MLKVNGSPKGVFEFSDVRIGGGGHALAMFAHAGGRYGTGTDVNNGYVRDTGDKAWTTLFTKDRLDATGYTIQVAKSQNTQGCQFVQFAKSNKNIGYGQFNAQVFKITVDPAKKVSEPGAITLTRWNLAPKQFGTNDGAQRLSPCGVAIHPTDPLKVLVGTNNDGVYYTLDGGANVTALAIEAGVNVVGHPIGSDGTPGWQRHYVASDPGDGNYWYTFTRGLGIKRSTTGIAGPYTLIAGSPTVVNHLFVDQLGRLWVTARGQALKSIERGNGTAWTSYTSADGNGDGWDTTVVDPFDSNVVIQSVGGIVAISLDRAATWINNYILGFNGQMDFTHTGEACWRNHLAAANIVFDPGVQGRMWMAEGYGVVRSEQYPTTFMGKFNWISADAGIEVLIFQKFHSNPSGGRFASHWDRPVMKLNDPDRWVNFPTTGYGDSITIGGQIDTAIDDPLFAVGSGGTGTMRHSYSVDGGRNWKGWNIADFPGAAGCVGAVAVSNKSNFIIAQFQDQPVVYTKDGGQTFQKVLLNGQPVSNSHVYYIFRWAVSADKTTPGRFALIVRPQGTVQGVTTNPDNRVGLWVTEDGGDNWVKKFAGIISDGSDMTDQDNRQFWKCQLEYVPGRAGELLYSPHADFANDKLFASLNNGQTWYQPNTNVRNVSHFGFGKALPGQAYPACFFFGQVAGELGYWVTFDWFATFIKASDQYPQGYIGENRVVGADISRFGEFYCDVSGKGEMIGRLVDRASAT